MFTEKSSCHGMLVIFISLCHITTCVSKDTTLTMMRKFTSGEPVYNESKSIIPFHLQSHRIEVPVSLNGSESVYRFLLDTGAMTWINEDLAVKLNLEKGEVISTLRKDKSATLTMVRSIRLGDMEVRNLIIPRMDIGEIFNDSFQYDGFLGADFLRFFSVTIDYEKRILTLADASVTYDETDEWISIPMTSTLPMWFPYIQGTLNDSINVPIMVDTGSPFALVVPLSFEERLCSAVDMECVRSRGVFARWPSTDPPCNIYARLHSFRIGDHVVELLPTLLTDLPMMVNTPLMGMAFLDKYRLRLDFLEAICHIQPVPGTYHETNVYTRGVQILRANPDSVVIEGVWEGSPADRNGVSPDGRVVHIQGIESAELNDTTIDSILADENIPFVTLGISEEQSVREVQLPKDALFKAMNR